METKPLTKSFILATTMYLADKAGVMIEVLDTLEDFIVDKEDELDRDLTPEEFSCEADHALHEWDVS